MPSEYTSSPVEQPATQRRTLSAAPRFSTIDGKTTDFSASNRDGSRKNVVTPTSRS
jgi:hypothetical protein